MLSLFRGAALRVVPCARTLSSAVHAPASTSAPTRAATVSAQAPAAPGTLPPHFWKVSPLDKSRLLLERDARDCYRNLAHLASDGRITRVGILQRLFLKVETAADLEFALKGLRLCKTRFMTFTPHTAAHFVRACLRANSLPVAIAHLASPVEFRLPVAVATMHVMIAAAAKEHNTSSLSKCISILKSRHGLSPLSYHCCIRALVDASQCGNAVDLYVEGSNAGVQHKPTVALKLMHGLTKSGVYSPQQVARAQELCASLQSSPLADVAGAATAALAALTLRFPAVPADLPAPTPAPAAEGAE